MDSITSSISTVHDLYVGAYECIGSIVNGIWSRVPHPFSFFRPTLNNLTTRSTEILYNAMVAGISRTIQLSNSVLRRPRNETIMRTCRPEIKELLQEAKSEITKLSKDCSIVFDRTIIFSKIPSQEETQEILEKLFQFKDNLEWLPPPRKEQAADRAIAACTRLHEIHQQLENMKGEEISSRDLEAFQESLSRNALLTTTVSATVENIGEMVGGMVVDEASPVISQEWNPAIQLGKKVAEHIGRPAGRLMGMAVGFTGIYYLMSKLPLMRFENQRTMVQAGAILLMFIVEYMHWNPLTNYLEEQGGELSYDLGFYSVALLFNYIGMYMAGTGESLGSYVRNMTPSMLVYNGANFAFEMIGFEGIIAGVLSFYLSHVAYNLDLYQSLFRGTLLVESVELDQMGATVNQQQIRSARRAITSMFLTELSQRMNCFNRAHLNAAAAGTVNAANELLPMAEPLIANANQQGIDQVVGQFMQVVMQGTLRARDLYEGTRELEEFDQELARLKNNLPYSEIAFFFRESIHFFQFLQLPPMKALIEEHKKEYLNVVAQSKSADLDGGQGPYLPFEESRKRIFKALLESFFGDRAERFVDSFRQIWDGEEVSIEKCLPPDLMGFLVQEMHLSPELIANLHRIWDPKVPLEIDRALLRRYIEPLIDEQLAMLYPLVPETSPEDEACSVYMMEMLTRALVIFSKLRVATGQADPSSARKLHRQEYLTFIKLITDFIFEIRFPSQSILSNLQRAGTRRLIQSQCHTTD